MMHMNGEAPEMLNLFLGTGTLMEEFT